MSTPTRLTEEPILKEGESFTKDKLVNFIKNNIMMYREASSRRIGIVTKSFCTRV